MLYHLREKTPVVTSQVLNRCVPYQDASLRFVDELSVGQTKCISPGQDFVIPSPSIKLDSDAFVSDQSALAMLQQANTFCCLTRCLQYYSIHFPASGDVYIPEMVGV